jgi:hypothetical protein
MTLDNVWRLLHYFFAFAFVGTLVVAEWNGRAARATQDWGERALLFRVIHLSSRVAGLGGLVMLGVFGHLHAVALGYKMSASPWLWSVTGLWLAAIVVMAAVVLPAVGRLADAAGAAAGGGAATGYDAALGRWRLGNVLMTLLYLTLLALMVFRWR